MIQLPDAVDAGTSGSIEIRVVPPNHTTPDGTSWELLPTVTGSNFATATAPEPATATATADIRPTIIKRRDAPFKEPGESVTWTVTVACQQPDAGNLLVNDMTVVDTLDPGFVYESSSGGGVYDAAAQTVTWTYDAASVPTSCSTPGETGGVEQTITGTVADGYTLGEQLPNRADVTATSFDDAKTKTVGANAAVTVVTEDTPPGPGTVDKYGYGQLSGPGVTDVGPGAYGRFQSTYPGRWRALNGRADLSKGGNNTGTTSAYFTQIVDSNSKGNQVRDAMPCLDNQLPATTTYQSQLGSVCANPAFHPTTVQVENRSGGFANTNPPGTFQPTAILTDGSSVDLVSADGSSSLWNVPAANVGDVAEIILPRYELNRDVQYIWIEGYADSSLVDGDILQNVVDIDQYYEDTKIGDLGDDGEIYVTDKPQIGVSKYFGVPGESTDGSTRVTFGNSLSTVGVPTEDFVIADILPAGMTWVGDARTLDLRKVDADGVESVPVLLEPELIDNYQGTGRQLVRFTVTEEQLTSFTSTGGGEFSVRDLSFDVTTPAEPGIYTNIVAAYYDSPSLDTVCLQSDIAQIADDPYDQNGNGSTSDRHCEAVASTTIESQNIGPDFKLAKTVQGSSDDAPRAWPAYGTVDEAGAPSSSVWTSRTSRPLR